MFTWFNRYINVITFLILVYPQNCTRYYGPHSIDCLITMWRTATCLQEGYKFPDKLTSVRLDELDAQNIRFVMLFHLNLFAMISWHALSSATCIKIMHLTIFASSVVLFNLFLITEFSCNFTLFTGPQWQKFWNYEFVVASSQRV